MNNVELNVFKQCKVVYEFIAVASCSFGSAVIIIYTDVNGVDVFEC